MNVTHEVELLKEEIKRLGSPSEFATLTTAYVFEFR